MALLLLSLGVSSAGAAAPQSANYACYQQPRLYSGVTGRVTTVPNLPNRLRDYPGYYGRVIAQIPPGATFTVLSGPHCENGLNWWQVNYGGRIGWTAEGNGASVYWLEPLGIGQPPPSSGYCALPNRLIVGVGARVTPGPPNVIRDAPGTQSTGANSRVIGQIPGGGIFNVTGGPVCASDGRWWWEINYQGVTGWTAEGEGSSYWVEPYSTAVLSCPGFMQSRLTPGGYGRVTTWPYLPNRVRATPTYGAIVLGQIPPGAVFQVISGPHCGQNTAWWQVSYNGIIGWTAEGDSGIYWLEPA
jgi:hypothetical protein